MNSGHVRLKVWRASETEIGAIREECSLHHNGRRYGLSVYINSNVMSIHKYCKQQSGSNAYRSTKIHDNCHY